MLHNKKSFAKGVFLLITFTVILILIFMPLFTNDKGKKLNGLEFSDDLFNKLSKGSSYFIPTISKSVDKIKGKTFDVTVKLKNPDTAPDTAKVLAIAGINAEVKDTGLKISGDLSKMLALALAASDKLYSDDLVGATALFEGMDGLKGVKLLWTVQSAMIKELQKAKMIEEASVVKHVNEKGIEPAYNFYGIPAENIGHKIPLVAGLLAFYVLYTMWYGYAIFDIFDGVGLSMKKSKVKKEV
jgi:hypothetical protein